MSGEASRLRWRCRRGMRELDAVLEAFLRNAYEKLDAEEKARFESLLELPDPQLHAYLLGRDEPHDPDLARLLGRIRTSLHP